MYATRPCRLPHAMAGPSSRASTGAAAIARSRCGVSAPKAMCGCSHTSQMHTSSALRINGRFRQLEYDIANMRSKESGYIKKTQSRNKFGDLMPPRPAVSERALMHRERGRDKAFERREGMALWAEKDRVREEKARQRKFEAEQAERRKEALFYGAAKLADRDLPPQGEDEAAHSVMSEQVDTSERASDDGPRGKGQQAVSGSAVTGKLFGRSQTRGNFGVRYSGNAPLPEESQDQIKARVARDREAKASIERLKQRIKAMLFEAPSVGAATVDPRPGDLVEWRVGENATAEICAVLPMPEQTGGESSSDDSGERSRGDTLLARNNKAVLTSKGEVSLAYSSDLTFRIVDFFSVHLATKATPAEARFFLNDSLDAPSVQTFDEHIQNLKEQGQLAAPQRAAGGADAQAASKRDTKGPTSLLEEPFDEERFGARNRMTRDLRVFTHLLDEEKKRLAPLIARRYLSDPDALREQGGTFSVEEVASDINEALYEVTAANVPKINRLINRPLSRVRTRRALKEQAAQGKNPYVLEKKEELVPEAPGLRAMTVLAVHQLLFQQIQAFLPDSSGYLQTLTYTGRVPEERRSMELIKGWVRSPPGSDGIKKIDGFCIKAKKILEWRSKRSGSGDSLEPRAVTLQPQDGPGVEWNEDDATIIAFLKTMLGTRRTVSLQGNDYATLAAQIVKGCGLDFAVKPTAPGQPSEVPAFLGERGQDVIDSPVDLQHAVIHYLLLQLGALAPWQTTLDIDPYYKSLFVDANSTSDVAVVSNKAKVEMTSAEIETQRHDFGQLEVFVIDDAAAFELDDGVSFEPAEGTTGQYWVHVHVADPTALLEPFDPIAQLAKQRHESTYLSGQQVSMLPHSFTLLSHLGSAGLEEAEARKRQTEGLRVLTYSARVDELGKVHDYRVRPSLVKNIKLATYEDIGTVLGGGEATVSPSLSGHEEQIRRLFKITQSLMLRRVENGAFFASRANVDVQVKPMPLPLHSSDSAISTLGIYEGFPSIALKMHTAASRKAAHLTGVAQEMVAEAMILAGRIAGAVASDLNVPVIYRGQTSPSAADVSRILRRRDEMGRINQVDFLTSDIRVSTAYASTVPVSHFALGITADGTKGVRDALSKGGYSRGTSPLRRYADLITHWQIKAGLRGAKPTWNVQELQAELPRFKFMEQRISANEKAVNHFWACMKLYQVLNKRRAGQELSSEEDQLLKAQPAVVSLADLRKSRIRQDARIRVQLTNLGLAAEMLWDKNAAPLPIGTVLDVQVHEITYTGAVINLIVKPVQV